MKNAQQRGWEREYHDSKLVTKSFEPQADVLRFLRFLRKECNYDITHTTQVLDLGCGVGRNALYVADHYGAHAIGYDFASAAISLAHQQNKLLDLKSLVTFEIRSIGEPLPLPDVSVDLVFDVTASHLLNPDERNVYLQEVFRVLKPGGYFFVRTLCRDGDRNAQQLLLRFPGEDYDTYIHPELHVTERVFREEDFRELYGLYFEILDLHKQTGYQQWATRSFKRRYLIAYLHKSL
jgi:SAM-dependent methyltransferase